MNKIAITGATGYIGSYLARYLKAQGFTIYEMTRNPNTHSTNQFIPYELGQKKLSLENIDALIHCAYDFKALGMREIRKINVEGSLDLFSQARKAGIKKIIYLSSVSSFAEAVSDYGRAKFEIEIQSKDFDIFIIRPGLVFNKNSGGIVKSLQMLVKKLPVVPIVGKGNQEFFPCHLEDLAILIEKILQHPVLINQPIVAASQTKITFKEIVTTIAKVHNKKIILLPVPYDLLFSILKFAEMLSLRTGLRSDSLKYMKHSNKFIDFKETNDLNVSFRPFNSETFQQ